MSKRTGFVALAAMVAAAPLALAQMLPMSGHGAPSHDTSADRSPSSVAYAAANAKMHEDMAIAFTGDADKDFVRGMIPHHRGAVDMAKVELEFGKDPEVRKLAEAIIKSQDAEIAWMKAWLDRQSK
jgi:uncharacterized protein (DUF305 family)